MRRAIRHLVIFALLGAAMSYVVTWGCMVALHRKDPQDWYIGRLYEVFALHGPGGKTRDVSEHTGVTLFAQVLHPDPLQHLYPLWVEPSRSKEAGVVRLHFIEGMPVRCVRCIIAIRLDHSSRVPLHKIRHALSPRIGSTEVLLAYDPYWPGLLLNTAFYGALLWVIWFSPGMIRRGIRRRRGRCPRCGYDLKSGGLALCPECGGGSA